MATSSPNQLPQQFMSHLTTIVVGKIGHVSLQRSARHLAPQKRASRRSLYCRRVSHLLSAAAPKQVGLAPDHNHVVPGPRRRRAPAGFQLSPLAMPISVPSSFSVGSFLGHLLHATFHTVHRRVLGPHAVGKNSRRMAGGTQTGALCV